MRAQGTPHREYAFGEFTLDVDRGALFRDDVEVRLRPKAFAVLSHLVEHPEQLVTKEELLNAIWGHTAVTEGTLTHCVIDIRKAIGDKSQRVIRTIPRRGYRFEMPVTVRPGASEVDATVPSAPTPAAPPADRHLPEFSFAAILLLFGAAVIWLGLTGRDVAAPPTIEANTEVAPAPSIAVLPFLDMSPGNDQAYFADSLAEELLNLLAKTSGLHVIALTSSFSFKGQNPDIGTITRKLGATHVLEGSIRKSGDRVRITAQLIDASTSVHLWSETFEHDIDDVFAVQDQIAASVADALKVTLAQDASSLSGAPRSTEAYERFLQAQFLFNRRGPGDVERARDYYRQAIEIDPSYARAWAGLAAAHYILMEDEDLPWDVSLDRMAAAVEQALALDPNLAEAHVRASGYYWLTGQQELAQEHLRRASALDPNGQLVLSVAAGSAFVEGRHEDAIELQSRAISRDPVAFVHRSNLAGMLFAAGRLKEAEAEYLEALALNPAMEAQIHTDLAFVLILQQRFNEAVALIGEYAAGEAQDQGLALAYHGLGREAEANAAFDRLLATPGADAAFRTAEVHAYRGNVAESFRWLATARTQLSTSEVHPRNFALLSRMCQSPFLEPLHADARWEQWLAHVTALRQTPIRSPAASALQARTRQVLKLEID